VPAAPTPAPVAPVLVASPAYLAARGMPDSPAELAGHDLVAFDSIATTNDWHFGTPGRPTERSSVRVEPRLTVNSADAAIAAAEAGLGIAQVGSYQVCSAIEAGRLSLVLPGFKPPPMPVSLIHLSRRLATPNIVAFIKAARAYFLATPIAPHDAEGAQPGRAPSIAAS